MKTDTGKFKVYDLVYDNGEFVLARGYWDGQENLSLACRWYEDDGIGYPQTFGKAQWMLLPSSIRLKIHDRDALNPKPKVVMTLDSKSDE